jgi:hypothetical protein
MNMNFITSHIKLFVFLLITIFALLFYARPIGEIVTDKTFVGKWKSSRLETPIHLYDNGEWEIKTEDGGVLQYGVWQYKDNNIIWSHMDSSSFFAHDVNLVVSAAPSVFQVKEKDGSTTTFVRFDQSK